MTRVRSSGWADAGALAAFVPFLTDFLAIVTSCVPAGSSRPEDIHRLNGCKSPVQHPRGTAEGWERRPGLRIAVSLSPELARKATPVAASKVQEKADPAPDGLDDVGEKSVHGGRLTDGERP